MKKQNLRFVVFGGMSVVMMFFSCARTVYVPAVRTERVIDTLTRTVADSAVLRALFACDSAGHVRLQELHDAKGRMAEMEMQLQGGELQVVTRWQTKYVDRIREVHDTTTVVEFRETVRVVRHVPRFFWVCFAVALLAVFVGGRRLWKRVA